MADAMRIPRRAFIASSAAVALAQTRAKTIPIGLELYSVRNEIKADLMGTVRGVAKMGYQGVEFWAPYLDWTTAYAKDVRKLLDDLGMKCWSTHNSTATYTAERMPHAIELNQILGCRYVVMAHPGKVEGKDGWKRVAETLNSSADKIAMLGMRAGYHNHAMEWIPVEGARPIDILTANTSKNVTFQLDTGTCLQAGADPVAFIRANPGRVISYHLKDWSPDPEKGYRVLLGEGIGEWEKLFEAAESVGGVEYYLIEQEGGRYPAMETAERCLANYRKLRRAA